MADALRRPADPEHRSWPVPGMSTQLGDAGVRRAEDPRPAPAEDPQPHRPDRGHTPEPGHRPRTGHREVPHLCPRSGPTFATATTTPGHCARSRPRTTPPSIPSPPQHNSQPERHAVDLARTPQHSTARSGYAASSYLFADTTFATRAVRRPHSSSKIPVRTGTVGYSPRENNPFGPPSRRSSNFHSHFRIFRPRVPRSVTLDPYGGTV